MEKTKDLVCGAEIEQERSAAKDDYKGKTYHFCSEECRDSFRQNPSNYIK